MIATLKNINPSLPMVAIGGITEDNCEPIAKEGADGCVSYFGHYT